MKNVVVILVCMVILFGCEKNSAQRPNIEQVLIGSGNLYGNGDEGIQKENIIIYNTVSWEELMTKIDSKNNESQNFTETEIDFNKFVVLAVFDEVKVSGGYSIQIEQVKEMDSVIKVIVKRSSPTAISPSVITQPFYISKILKPDKKIVFKE